MSLIPTKQERFDKKVSNLITDFDENGDRRFDEHELSKLIEAILKVEGVSVEALVNAIGVSKVMNSIGHKVAVQYIPDEVIDAELAQRTHEGALQQLKAANEAVNHGIKTVVDMRLEADKALSSSTQAIQDRDAEIEKTDKAEAELNKAKELFQSTLGASPVFASAANDLKNFEEEVQGLRQSAADATSMAAATIDISNQQDSQREDAEVALTGSIAFLEELIGQLDLLLEEELIREANELVKTAKAITETEVDTLDVPDYLE